MLTLLVRYQMSRREVLSPATSVEYAPPREQPQNCSWTTEQEDERQRYNRDVAGLLVLNGEEGRHLTLTPIGDLDYRDVFVMNDHGATVARYTL